jgi:hypothetical protein
MLIAAVLETTLQCRVQHAAAAGLIANCGMWDWRLHFWLVEAALEMQVFASWGWELVQNEALLPAGML